jgi:hypothetical protein
MPWQRTANGRDRNGARGTGIALIASWALAKDPPDEPARRATRSSGKYPKPAGLAAAPARRGASGG